jgi:hypothetical protein
LLANVTASEIKAALDFETGFGFDFLGEEFAEDHLLSEILGADDGMVWAGRGAGGQKTAEKQQVAGGWWPVARGHG